MKAKVEQTNIDSECQNLIRISICINKIEYRFVAKLIKYRAGSLNRGLDHPARWFKDPAQDTVYGLDSDIRIKIFACDTLLS